MSLGILDDMVATNGAVGLGDRRKERRLLDSVHTSITTHARSAAPDEDRRAC